MSQRMSGALSLAASLAVVIGLSCSVFAQEPTQEGPQRPAAEKTAAEKQKSQTDASQSNAELLTIIKTLADEVHNLTGEVRQLRHAYEQNADTMQLVVYEDRLARVKDEINSLTARKGELDANEQHQQYRLDNIQQEMMVRGQLNRGDAEAAIRADIQRSFQDIHAQQAANQKRLTDLQIEEAGLHSKIDELRRKMSTYQGSGDHPK